MRRIKILEEKLRFLELSFTQFKREQLSINNEIKNTIYPRKYKKGDIIGNLIITNTYIDLYVTIDSNGNEKTLSESELDAIKKLTS